MRSMLGVMLVAVGVGFVVPGCGSVPANTSDAAVDAEAADASGLCAPNSMSCGNDDALYQCDADGTALTKVQDCQYGCAVDRCKECEPNTTFCNSDELVACDSNGMIVNPQTCQFGCQMNRCNTCEPSTAYCSNANAVTCGANGEPAATMACGSAGCAGGVCNACTPNTTTCHGDTLVVCNGAGMVQSTTSCALGCETTPNTHCKVLVPSYSVPPPSGTLPNLNVNAAATLDISDCSATPNSVQLDIGGNITSLVGAPQVAVRNQSGGPPICIVRFGTISIAQGFTLTVRNSATEGHVLSLQAVGDVQIDGRIDFASSAPGPSPGTTVVTYGMNSAGLDKAPGAGGGGGAYDGGAGGSCVSCNAGATVAGGNGGAAVTTTSTVLTGGSAGGKVLRGSTAVGVAGLGGGGLQLVSLTRIAVGATGVVSANGWGGSGIRGIGMNFKNLPAGGGGSGGTLVVEAPVVSLSAGAIVVANGGGGAGGCYLCSPGCQHVDGWPGQLSATRAAGGNCNGSGNGGYAATGAALPPNNGANSDADSQTVAGGGGGGAQGFIFVRGRTAASVMIAGSAIVSPAPMSGAVIAN